MIALSRLSPEPCSDCVALGHALYCVRLGGRCQHLADDLMQDLEGPRHLVLLARASDGNDYLDGVGGGIVDNHSCNRARALGLSVGAYLSTFNTHELHKRRGTLILAEPTATNVFDLILILFDTQ